MAVRCGVTGLGLRDGDVPVCIRIEAAYADEGVKPGLYSVIPETYAKYAPRRLKYLQERGILSKDVTELPGNFAH